MILVTGAAGYIGSQIVHTLHRTFAQPKMIGVDNLSTGHTCKLPPGFDCFHGDVGARAFMTNLIMQQKVDQIIHCAASVSVPDSIKRPLDYYHNNTAATLALIEAAKDCGVGSFVFSSTAAVYGEPEFRRPVREDDPCRPITPYGKSKLMAEEFLRDSGLPSVILRYFNVAGADPLGQTGPAGKPAHLIARACEAVRGLGEITLYGNGTRDYIHVADLAAAHLGALEWGGINQGCATFNVGCGQGHTTNAVIATVEVVAGKPVPAKATSSRPGDPTYIVGNTDKIRRFMKWAPQYSLTNMVEDTLRWQKK